MARTVAGAAPGRTNRRFLIIAILFAALSGALVYAWMNSQSGDGEGGGTAAGGSRQVVVAKIVINHRTEITKEMLEVKSIPANAVVEGGYATVDEVIGKTAKLRIEPNQQVLSTAVVNIDGPADALAQVIPNGRRGFAIKAHQVLTAGGLILPGDYVDIVWVCCPGGLEFGGGDAQQQGQENSTDAVILTRTIVQNVQVAAIQQQIVSSGPVASGDGTGIDDDPVASDTGEKEPEAITITLLATPEQAHILFMAEQVGELRAALRGVGDAAIIPPTEDYICLSPSLIPEETMQALRAAFGQGPQ
jgi:pilus assembly protein CpaB